MPAIYRQVFTLRDLQGLEVDEVAKLLDTLGNVVRGASPSRENVTEAVGVGIERVRRSRSTYLVLETIVKLECEHLWRYISDYLDGTAEPETLTAIELHREHWEVCSAVLDSTRNILVLSVDHRVFEMPAGFSDRLHGRLQELLNSESPR